MAKSPILGGFSAARSRFLADNELVNLIVEIVETKDGVAPGALYNAPGLDLVAALGSGPIRGVRDLNGLLYVVSGPDVYSLTSNGVATLCGSIGAAQTPVSMFANTTQLMIVDGVGGWLVPGGSPLTGGTIDAPGGLYAINDEITLQGDSGTASANPVITVSAISNNPVTTYKLGSYGTSYSSATNVPTTAIAGQAGVGSGLLINISAGGGPIGSIGVDSGGSGYAVGDTGFISSGSGDAVYQVKTISGGAVTAVTMLNPGTSYTAYTGATTAAAPAVPANAGLGLRLNITASSGPITGSTLAAAGQGYVVGAVGLISGGSDDATYLVTATGASGSVTGFTVSQGGAVSAGDWPLTFKQKSTTGSGSGFTLSSPGYGAWVGVVPVILPFPNPVMGAISDGFGLLVFRGSQSIAQSDEADLSTWQALNYGVANQSPDNCMAIAVIHDQAFIPKQRNTEVWADAGTAGFAFQPLSAVHMEYGIEAPFSLAKLGEVLIWLARNDQGQGLVVMAKGYQVDVISTQALTNEFDGYANRGDAIGYGYQQGGHVFYVLTFPEANRTWQYDMTSSAMLGYPLWNRLAAWEAGAPSGTTPGMMSRHWGNCFWNWRGTGGPISQTSTYQANSVTIVSPTRLATTTGLNGLARSFATALLSVWLLIPDGSTTGLIFSNQTDDTHATTTPGLFVAIHNDATGTPQITVEAFDATGAAIVTATYDYASWGSWVNILLSIDTATQVLQAYASTIVSAVLVETRLTPVAITWASTNPIAPAASQPWHLQAASA